jgi:hypothetical protein
VEVTVKDFVHKINVHLKISFPKVTKDLECKRMRIGIGANEGCIVEGFPFTTLIIKSMFTKTRAMMTFSSFYGKILFLGKCILYCPFFCVIV